MRSMMLRATAGAVLALLLAARAAANSCFLYATTDYISRTCYHVTLNQGGGGAQELRNAIGNNRTHCILSCFFFFF